MWDKPYSRGQFIFRVLHGQIITQPGSNDPKCRRLQRPIEIRDPRRVRCHHGAGHGVGQVIVAARWMVDLVPPACSSPPLEVDEL